MADELPTPEKYEELTKDQVLMLLRMFPGPQAMVLGLTDIDPSKGAGIIKDGGGDSKCVWTREGHRITIAIGSGALTASKTKEPDPLADPEAR